MTICDDSIANTYADSNLEEAGQDLPDASRRGCNVRRQRQEKGRCSCGLLERARRSMSSAPAAVAALWRVMACGEGARVGGVHRQWCWRGRVARGGGGGEGGGLLRRAHGSLGVGWLYFGDV